MDYGIVVKNIRAELKAYIQKSGLKALVLGVSGGVDSCLVSVLAKPVCDDLGILLIGRSIIIDSNKQDEIDRAREVGRLFCTDFNEVNLTDMYTIIKDTINDLEGMPYKSEDSYKTRVRHGNFKARIRNGFYLYNLAHANNGMVIGTTNATEYELGYYTIAGGDGSVDYEPIVGLWKSEVYDMCKWLIEHELGTESEKKAVHDCIVCVATAGLGVSVGDLDELGKDTYEEVDHILQNPEQYPDDVITKRQKTAEFKKYVPISLNRSDIL